MGRGAVGWEAVGEGRLFVGGEGVTAVLLTTYLLLKGISMTGTTDVSGNGGMRFGARSGSASLALLRSGVTARRIAYSFASTAGSKTDTCTSAEEISGGCV